MIVALLLAGVTFAGAPGQAAAQAPETVAEIRVHGNHVTADEEVVAISGVSIGAPFTATTVADVERKLRASKKFQDVQVLKRYASIEDMSKIVLVLVVNEGAVRIDVPDDPTAPVRVVKRRGLRNLMFMPILDAEDGYGVTFGVRLALVNVAGKRSRVSFPLTAGGTDRAGIELERNFERGPFTRLEIGSAIQGTTNPAYLLDDTRRRLWGKAERAIGPLRLGATGGSQWVTFGGVGDDFRSIGGTAAYDTRLDPVMPRNAVFASATAERLFFGSGQSLMRMRLDGRGYLGLFRQTVLVARAVRETADQPVPLYLRSLLGGWSSLRGFKAGSFTGDTLVAGSLELRVPLNSPVSFGKIGVSGFVDSGTTYDHGQRLHDQAFHIGIGGSGWITAGPLKLSLSVARGLGAQTRVNFGGGLSF